MQDFSPSPYNFWLDHGNALLYNICLSPSLSLSISLSLTNCLRQVENYAACLATCNRKRENIAPNLFQLC